MSSWATRLDADERANDVIRALNLDMTPAQLRSMVTVSTNLDTLLINIDVDMPDIQTAGRVARTYGEQFVQWRNESNAPIRLEDRINAELIDQPAISLFRPNTTFNVAAGALLGILIGGSAVFALEYLSANIVRRREDVERALNLPVLGALPAAE
jgi:capsular polysaccharide biosynthesis protein